MDERSLENRRLGRRMAAVALGMLGHSWPPPRSQQQQPAQSPLLAAIRFAERARCQHLMVVGAVADRTTNRTIRSSVTPTAIQHP